MNATSQSKGQRAVANVGIGQDEFFNLHASGCGYLSRVRWVEPKSKGRKAEPFLACAINALRGNVTDPAYTYFDLRVSGEEASQIVEQLKPEVGQDRKVFVVFKVGDFYAHTYERKRKDGSGRDTGEMESAALIKGRLLLITHVKIDGETVYKRDDEQRVEIQVQASADVGESRDEDGSEGGTGSGRAQAASNDATMLLRRPTAATRPPVQRMQVRSNGRREAVAVGDDDIAF